MLTSFEIAGILLTFLTFRILLPAAVVFVVGGLLKNLNRQYRSLG